MTFISGMRLLCYLAPTGSTKHALPHGSASTIRARSAERASTETPNPTPAADPAAHRLHHPRELLRQDEDSPWDRVSTEKTSSTGTKLDSTPSAPPAASPHHPGVTARATGDRAAAIQK